MSYGGHDNGAVGSSIGLWLLSMIGLFAGIIGSCILIVILKKRFVSGEKGDVENGEGINPFAPKEQPQSNLCTAENSHKNYEQNLYTTRHTERDAKRRRRAEEREQMERKNAALQRAADVVRGEFRRRPHHKAHRWGRYRRCVSRRLLDICRWRRHPLTRQAM